MIFPIFLIVQLFSKDCTATSLRVEDKIGLENTINGFSEISDFRVTIGNSENPDLFSYSRGSYKKSDPVINPVYSAGKWVSGVVIMAVVQDGFISLDAFARDWLSFWTKDPNNLGYNVTLRHFLAFTSGYDLTDTGARYGNEYWCNWLTVSQCAERIYKYWDIKHAPGTKFDYNLLHLQTAGAMIESATDTCFTTLAERYVFRPAQMSNSYYEGWHISNPGLGKHLATNSAEYSRFLHLYFNNYLLAKKWTDEMEKLGSPSANYPGGWKYGLANWFYCPKDVEWSTCQEMNVHHSMGADGFLPVINRQYNYWIVIATSVCARKILPFCSPAPTTRSRNLLDLLLPKINKIFSDSPSLQTFSPNEKQFHWKKITTEKSSWSTEKNCNSIMEPKDCFSIYGCEWDAINEKKCVRKPCAHIDRRKDWGSATCQGSFTTERKYCDYTPSKKKKKFSFWQLFH